MLSIMLSKSKMFEEKTLATRLYNQSIVGDFSSLLPPLFMVINPQKLDVFSGTSAPAKLSAGNP